jgi:integrase
MERWTLRLDETKNGDGRYIPVVGIAQIALQDHFNNDATGEGWVFKGYRDDAPADIEKKWRLVRDAAGLKDFRFHDLRHTTASYLTQSGAGLAQVADALGHKTLAMARRYSHQSGEHVRATLASIAGKLED